MSDFENDETQEIEFVALDKIQALHDDFEQCLEYRFGKSDFVEDTEKQHFLLKSEIAKSIVLEIEKSFGSKISLDLTSDSPIDLLVFLNILIGEELSNTEPKLGINLFVVEAFDELEQDIGAWRYLDKDTVNAENSNSWFEDPSLDAEGDTNFDSLVSMDESFLEQLTQMLQEDESTKEMLENFMNHLVMDMLESKGDLTNEEALQKFLEIAKKRSGQSNANAETETKTPSVSEIFVDFSKKEPIIKGADDEPESNS